MASVIREIIIDATPERVWSAVGDFANGPLQMSQGVLAGCRLDGDDSRILTFANGMTARERLIARDESCRRIVWGWVGDDVVHDNTSMQVFSEGVGQTRLVWIHDTLPDQLTEWLSGAMDQFVPAMQQALKAR